MKKQLSRELGKPSNSDYAETNQLQSDDPFVVEIGSNDGIMLQNFKKANIRHLGVEPWVTVKVKLVLAYIFSVALYGLNFLVPRSRRIWVFGAWYGLRYSDNSKYFRRRIMISD